MGSEMCIRDRLNVVQSVELKYPFDDADACEILIVVDPLPVLLEAIGAVPETDVTPEVAGKATNWPLPSTYCDAEPCQLRVIVPELVIELEATFRESPSVTTFTLVTPVVVPEGAKGKLDITDFFILLSSLSENHIVAAPTGTGAEVRCIALSEPE